MDKSLPSRQDDPLASYLHREAAESCPPFSESLHAKIVEAVGQAVSGKQCDVSPLRIHRGKAHVPRYAPIGAAASVCVACVVLMICMILWPHGTSRARLDPSQHAGHQERTAEPTSPDVADGPALADKRLLESPRVLRAVGLIDEVTAGFEAGQWAYLDHDARIATRLLVGQLALAGPLPD